MVQEQAQLGFNPQIRLRGFRIGAVGTGVMMALLAVIASAFFDAGSTEAYGICMACHGRDLVNSAVNAGFGSTLTTAPVSASFPLLTGLGVLLGAGLAAVLNGEFRPATPENPLKAFIYGVLVMNFALLAAGCTIRLILRMSNGELLGLLGVLGLVVGILAGTTWLRWRAGI